MAFATVQSWSETAGSNTEIDGTNIDEGCNPSGINNAIRELMSQVASWTGDDTIASATTTDLSTVNGQYVTISGTTTITGFGTVKAGWLKFLKFDGALTLTHNATSLILPGTANITTAAGDTAVMVSLGSGNWRCLAFQPAAGYPRLSGANTWTADQTFTKVSDDATGPNLSFYHVSTSPAASDAIGTIDFVGKDSGGADVTYARMRAFITDPTNTSEDGFISLDTSVNGAMTRILSLSGGGVVAELPVLVPDGSVSAPSVALSDDTDTGLYSPGAGVVAVTLNGVEHSRFSGTSLLVGATTGWANDSGTQDGFNITKPGQIIASNTSNTTGSFRRQGTDGRMFNFYKLTTLVGGIDVDGSSTTYNTTSDGRLKENFQEFDAGAIIDEIDVYKYNWIADGSVGYGPVAQELYAVFPQAVSVGSEDGADEFVPWGYDPAKLVPVLIKELQSLRSRLDAAGI